MSEKTVDVSFEEKSETLTFKVKDEEPKNIYELISYCMKMRVNYEIIASRLDKVETELRFAKAQIEHLNRKVKN